MTDRDEAGLAGQQVESDQDYEDNRDAAELKEHEIVCVRSDCSCRDQYPDHDDRRAQQSF
ncbi:hypothetical protein ACIHDR_47550 [Nocardia sp. NPDC052278]|uniref:hypothetical protein n=1 Tax=unclassified Nocardia TaxID=2637762 RepID=UPI0036C860E1